MKKSGVRRGVLVYKGPDPAGKMEIPVKAFTCQFYHWHCEEPETC